MAQVKCPQCGKVVDPSEGYCMYCGYTFDDGEIKSPFASAGAASQAFAAGTGSTDYSEPVSEETSGGAPVLRFDAGSYDSMPLPSAGRSSSDLMFGIGMCRILSIFFALLVILAMVIPFVTSRITINKSMLTKNTDTTALVRAANEKDFDYKDDGTYISISRSVSLIQAPSRYLYLMIAACIAGIVFAVRGQPAGYLVCGIAGAVLAGFNYVMNFSSIDAVMKSSAYTRLAKAGGQYGITLSVDKGAGAVLMLIGGIGMIVAAIIFLNNHEAYDK